jgi:micrococcal nuclease
MSIKVLVCALLLMLGTNATAQPLALSIAYFYDGDTVKINDGGLSYKLRISDIDAPELQQVYGKKSKRALMHLCKNAAIAVEITGQDKYSRQLGHLQCNQITVSDYMVKNGHAWANHYHQQHSPLIELEAEARQNKLGL